MTDAPTTMLRATPVDSSAVVHDTAVVDEGATIGPRTRVWHFCHVMSGAVVGADCMLGQGCFVAGRAVVGNRVKLQNGVNVYDGVVLEDDVFCGPGATFTNVANPRSFVERREEYVPTLVRRGATVGANATIVCGTTLGEYCLVAAGAVVCGDVPAHALVAGVPASVIGWVSRHGDRLVFDDSGMAICAATGERYEKTAAGVERRSDEESP